MLYPAQIKTDRKIIIAAIVGLFLIGGVWALVARYFEAFSDMNKVVAKNPVQQQAVDLARLGEDYQASADRIISEFLAATAVAGADVAALAEKAQSDLLALSLPAQFRSRHLAEVLLLTEIGEAASGKSEAALAAKLEELRQLSLND